MNEMMIEVSGSNNAVIKTNIEAKIDMVPRVFSFDVRMYSV